MKMVKKILLGFAATAAVLSMAGCKMESGEGELKGSKWDNTMIVDATGLTGNDENGKELLFRRYWKQFSSSEKVAEITTTITINPADCKFVTDKASVVGLLFDLNKSASDDNKVDFCIIGVNPNTQGFYTERYVGISKQKNESLDTNASSLATDDQTTDIGYGQYSRTDLTKWNTLDTKMYSVDDNGIITCVVKITQSDMNYSISLGSVKVAEYNASESTYVEKIDGTDYAVGGIACYGNAGKGVKLVANYKTEKDAVTGKLEAEEIAE